MVQHVSSGRDNTAVTAPTYTIVLPNPTLSGNCLVLRLEHDGVMTTSSVKTGLGSGISFSAGPTETASGQDVESYYVQPTVGTSSVTIVTTGFSSQNSASFDLTEFAGTACTVRSSTASATKSVSLTSVVSGDIVWMASTDVSSLTPTITAMHSAVNFSTMTENVSQGTFSEYAVGVSGSVSAAFTSSDSDSWNSVAIDFTSGSGGTLPASTGIRIINMYGEAYGKTTHTMQVPCQGNLLIGMWSSGATNLSALSSSPSNTWSLGNSTNTSNGEEYAQVFYAANPTCSGSLTLSPTYGGTDTLGYNFLVMFDVTGAATSPHDVDADNSGDQTSEGVLTTNTMTPTTANGLVLDSVIWYQNTVTSVSPGSYAGIALNNKNNNVGGATVPSTLNEDDGRGMYYNPNTSQFSWSYSQTGSAGVGYWAAAASAFKAATTTSSSPLSHFVIEGGKTRIQ